jgi:hypothetical protein
VPKPGSVKLEESIRDGSWAVITVSLDGAVGTFCYLVDARLAAVLAGGRLGRIRYDDEADINGAMLVHESPSRFPIFVSALR